MLGSRDVSHNNRKLLDHLSDALASNVSRRFLNDEVDVYLVWNGNTARIRTNIHPFVHCRIINTECTNNCCMSLCYRNYNRNKNYEVVSKILRTDAAIYTAVVVARNTDPNKPNC
jgi:hypothetical protein